MTISDEQLSAFLDAELPEHEMEFIRQQLSEDESLTNRLAELAIVDSRIANHYSRIDERPMPEAVTRLLADEQSAANTSAQVTAFPLWKRVHRTLQQHAAMAASVALVIGFGAAQLLPGNNTTDNWNAVAQVLDNARSGTEQILGDGSRVKPRLSFINQDGHFCRQFQTIESHRSAESIACNIDGHWQLNMSVYSPEAVVNALQEGDYQTASGGSTQESAAVDAALDEMMQGDAFDAEAETQAINNKWKHIQP